MEILAKESDWTQTDEERWAAFLETDTGRRLIPKLVEHVPELLPGGEINAILIRSGEVRSFSRVIETLLFLAHPPKAPAEPNNEYPSLTDDRAWNDGQKLENPPKPKQ